MSTQTAKILGRIQQYLVGGFFNPEAMEHDKVQRMVMDARDEIQALASELAEALPMLHQLINHCEACEGYGAIIYEDEGREEPCLHCRPIYSLIGRIEPPKPAPVPPMVADEDDGIAF